MNKYKVKLEVQGSIEIDELIEANSYDEAVNVAIKEYGHIAWYEFCGDAELIEENEEDED